jgi:hypothetical protein
MTKNYSTAACITGGSCLLQWAQASQSARAAVCLTAWLRAQAHASRCEGAHNQQGLQAAQARVQFCNVD